MKSIHSETKSNNLRQHIEAFPEDSVLFRSDFPEYHAEYVGSVLSKLTKEGVLLKVGQGIYAKPRRCSYGSLAPSIDKIVKAISLRDNTKVIPFGPTALNALGLSTQVPMKYSYLTTGSERTIYIKNQEVVFKHGVPKNFCFTTILISLMVQALKALKRENVGRQEIQTLRELVDKETDKESLNRDVNLMPGWMKNLVKPMLNYC